MLIAGCIILGVCGFVAGTGIYYNEKEKKERKAAIQKEINFLKEIISGFEELKTEIEKAKTNISDARKSFINGGHNFNGNPPVKNYFSSSIQEMDEALKYAQAIIEECNKEITIKESEKANL